MKLSVRLGLFFIILFVRRTYKMKFNGSQLPSGIYICKISINGFASYQKMQLLK